MINEENQLGEDENKRSNRKEVVVEEEVEEREGER